jgi:tetraprenyl-beta-curcumene synthase
MERLQMGLGVVPMGSTGSGRIGLTTAFAGAARRYWLGVFPRVCTERRRREARAAQIPDALLQRVVLDALRKWGNIEGATAFAAFAPARRRAAAARAMGCFQAAYNYLDMLTELPNTDPEANGRLLHRALLVALDPDAQHLDYYEHHHLHDDGGYLAETVDECRGALAELPSYAAVAPAARRAAERIVAFQSCNTGEVQADYFALERWARAATPPGTGLRWWETAASGGSSLGVYALICAAAQPRVDEAEIAAIEQAYFPWIGALHSLLDNLVDVAEDYATGQRSLVGCYASSLDAATRMRLLAERSLQAAAELPGGQGHQLILAAMASFYLSTSEASAPAARPVARAVLEALGEPAQLSMFVFRSRLRLRRFAPRAPGAPARRGSGAEVVLPAAVDAIAPAAASCAVAAAPRRGSGPHGMK